MKKSKVHLIFIGPALVLLLLFAIMPIVIALLMSFTDMDLSGLVDYSNINFIGFENYKTLLSDPEFLQTMYNTLYYVVIGVPLVLILSLLIATGINSISGKLGNLYRGLFYLPAITNTVAIAFVWLLLYNRSYGIFNYLLDFINVGPIDFLGDPAYAKLSLIALAVWKGIGLNMIILLAGLTVIPKDYYEAASIDGAGKIRRFFNITLPQLKFAIYFVMMTTIIGWMQFFDEIYVLDVKDTAEAKSMALFIYESAFQNPNEYGLGAAASMILFSFIIIFTIVQLRLQKED